MRHFPTYAQGKLGVRIVFDRIFANILLQRLSPFLARMGPDPRSRELLWLGVTAHPSAQWVAQQLTEALGWMAPPRYLIRDRDCAYGEAFIRRVGAMGIRDRPVSARSPWQNGYVERLIGSIRRDCLDHVVVFGKWHLRHLLHSYQRYYNDESY